MGVQNFIVNLAPSPLVKLFAGPYVAGDSIEAAVNTARTFWEERRVCSTIDLLGDLSMAPMERYSLLTSKGRIAFINPLTLGSDVKSRPSAVKYILFPSLGNGKKAALTRMPKSEALACIIQNSFNFESFGAEGFDTLLQVIEQAEPYRLCLGTLADGIRLAQDLIV